MRRSLLGFGTISLVAAAPFACGFDSSGVPGQGWGGGTHSSTHSSSSGGGAPPSCNPGESIICYTGPVGTAGKGICKAGTKTCNDDGLSYAPCTGEVTPATEDCSTSLDENCDGNVNESCPCTPGTTEACYTGPAGTENVGICKGSMHTCNPDGMGFGPCNGEVTPGTEDCTTPEDEDCDGMAFGAAGSACKCQIGTMAPCMTGLQGVCANGTQTCAGDASASDYGACTGAAPAVENCATPDDESCDGQGMCTGGSLVAKSAGTPTTKDDIAFATAFDGSGNYIAGGVINGAFGSMGVTEGALWLAKYSPAGAVVWEKTIAPTGNPAYAVVFGVAVDATGNVYAAGEYQGVLGFGGGITLTSDGSGTGIDAFLVKLDGAGTAQWAKSFGAGAVQTATSVAVDAQGNVLVAGGMQGNADFGGGMLTSGGSYDAFVAKFDAAGAHQWSKRAGDAGFQYVWGVAAAPNGDALIVGEVDGHLNFGQDLNAGADRNAFVVRLKGSDGSHLWSKQFGDGQGQAAYGVAADAQGNPVITGGFKGNINFGPGNIPSTNNNSTNDVFVAKLAAADGAHLWSKGFGTANDQYGNRVALDALGNVVVTGSFAGTINFGGTNLVNPDTTFATYDAFVVKLAAADGAHLWSRAFGDNTDQDGWDVAVDKLGNIAVAGGFNGTMNFGAPASSLTSGGGYDIYAVKLQP